MIDDSKVDSSGLCMEVRLRVSVPGDVETRTTA